jgi:hypothetical protein
VRSGEGISETDSDLPLGLGSGSRRASLDQEAQRSVAIGAAANCVQVYLSAALIGRLKLSFGGSREIVVVRARLDGCGKTSRESSRQFASDCFRWI